MVHCKKNQSSITDTLSMWDNHVCAALMSSQMTKSCGSFAEKKHTEK
jgi:hypothetical protein